jgi:hypothetical protein
VSRLDDQLAEISVLDKSDLQERWVQLTEKPLPKVSLAMLRLAVAYELQTQLLGGLPKKERHRIEGTGTERAAMQEVRPGMRLAREYGGTIHVVTIDEQGEVCWNGKTWRSLSEVARAITGTRWSGPAFFGLRDARRAA